MSGGLKWRPGSRDEASRSCGMHARRVPLEGEGLSSRCCGLAGSVLPVEGLTDGLLLDPRDSESAAPGQAKQS